MLHDSRPKPVSVSEFSIPTPFKDIRLSFQFGGQLDLDQIVLVILTEISDLIANDVTARTIKLASLNFLNA